MTGPSSSPGSDEFPLSSVTLNTHVDSVLLAQSARRAGVEFSLDPDSVDRLAAAVLEAGRRLLAAPGVRADVMLADGPSLAVRFHIPDAAALGGPAALEQSIAVLQRLVHRLRVVPAGDGATVTLLVLFGRTGRGGDAGLASRAVSASKDQVSALLPEAAGAAADLTDPPLLQELLATNRRLVALYGSLDARTEQLGLADDRFRLLESSVEDYAVCSLSADGVVTSWSTGAERLFGFPADEIIGRAYGTLHPPPAREHQATDAHLVVASADGRYESDCLLLRGDGSAFAGRIVLTPVRNALRDVQGFSLVVRDVTERKRLEEDLRERAEDLAAANRAKEDFLAILSHELRTPLNAMLGWTRLLRMGRMDGPGVERALETIERNAHLQEQLIADILDVSRIVTGKLRLELRPTDLAPLLHVAADSLRQSAQAKGIELTSRVDFAGAVLGDADRMQQVVWNLLANAIKFTPAGGSVSLSLARQGPSAVVTVTDTGEGISAELLPYVFDRFRQGDASITRPHSGLGLGLSIVRHIVELHGGKVQVRSEGKGRGSTFAVELPLRAVGRLRTSATSSQSLSGLKILVVDDESDARDLVSHALTQCGARTVVAASAVEAMRIMGEFEPDVLISDIRMPGEDGYELIRQVRALEDSVGANVPAVALTGLADPDDRRRALTAGYQRFMPKPVEVEELAEVVRQVSRGR